MSTETFGAPQAAHVNCELVSCKLFAAPSAAQSVSLAALLFACVRRRRAGSRRWAELS